MVDITHFFGTNRINNTESLTLKQQLVVRKHEKSKTTITKMHILNDILKNKPKTLKHIKSENPYHITSIDDTKCVSDNIIKFKNNSIVSDIKFSKDQVHVTHMLIKFLYDPKYTTFGLYGYAGTGKTSLITEIISFLMRFRLSTKIALTAPTHQALNELKSKMNCHNKFKNIDYHTIHRILQYSNDFDDNGNKIFVKSKTSLLSKYDFIIIDETSMIGEKILTDIFADLSDNHTKVIFIGDPCQLTPVNEKISPLFTKSGSQYINEEMKYVMTSIVRNNDAQINLMCESLRKWINNEITNPRINRFVGPKVKIFFDKNEWINKYLSKKYIDNSSMISWTNRASNEYNQFIRQKMFKKTIIKEYEVGDKIIFNDYYKVIDEKSTISFHTSNIAKIIKIECENVQFSEFSIKLPASKRNIKNGPSLEALYIKCIHEMNKNTTRYYKLWKFTIIKLATNKEDDSVCAIIYVLHSDELEKYKKELDYTQLSIKNLLNEYMSRHQKSMNIISKYIIKPLWKQRDDIFIKPIASIDYGNSRTCHKSQGSTYYNVFVDIPDMLLNTNSDDSKRCIYVACSRASNKLFILLKK